MEPTNSEGMNPSDLLQKSMRAAADLAATCNTQGANELARTYAMVADEARISGGEYAFACARLLSLCISPLDDFAERTVMVAAIGNIAMQMEEKRRQDRAALTAPEGRLN